MEMAAFPIIVLASDDGGMIIAILVFLLVIGGVFNSLENCGMMKYMLDKIVNLFGGARYKLLAAVTFFFMAMGAFIGSFEECVPLVPIVVALDVSLGWDSLTGMGMSLLAVGYGFASGDVIRSPLVLLRAWREFLCLLYKSYFDLYVLVLFCKAEHDCLL